MRRYKATPPACDVANVCGKIKTLHDATLVKVTPCGRERHNPATLTRPLHSPKLSKSKLVKKGVKRKKENLR